MARYCNGKVIPLLTVAFGQMQLLVGDLTSSHTLKQTVQQTLAVHHNCDNALVHDD